MKRTTILIVVLLVTAAGWYKFVHKTEFSSARPEKTTPPISSVPAPASSLILPLTVPIKQLEEFANNAFDKTFKGSKKEGPIRISWSANRSDLSMRGSNDTLHVSTRLSGQVDIKADDPVTKVISDILGRILCRNPGQKLAEVDLSATVSGSISPSINENWYLDLNSLGAKANITDAKLRILCFPSFSLRSKLQKEADEWAKSQLTKLKNRSAKDTNIKRSAQRAWKSICGSFPVDKETNLWLEINPLFARTSRVKIDDKTITLQVGVDVRSRLGDKETNPSCSFPNKLLIDQPRKGAFNIGLAGDIPYSLIDSQLRKATVGKESKGMVRVVVRDIGIGAYGQSILLQVRLSLKPEHWWRAGAEGTIFLTAVPTLRVTDQALVLDDIQLDVDSRNVLVEVAGEVAAPVIVALLRRHNVVDLREFMDGTLRSRANRAFRGLSTQEFKVEGGVEDIRLTSLAVGPESIRLAARARGTVSVDVERLRKPAQ